MEVIHKTTKEKIYSLRLDPEEEKMVESIKNAGINLPAMLRKHIKDIYKQITMDIDDKIYS